MPATTLTRRPSARPARRAAVAAVPQFALAPVVAAALIALLPSAHAQTTVVLPTRLEGGALRGADAPAIVNNTMTINQTAQRGVIEWSNFSIGAGGTVNFKQPDATSLMLNRVIGNTSGSRIDGALTANGRIMILDPSGLTFGRGSTVQVGSLIGAAMDFRPAVGNDPYADFLAGSDLSLTASPFGRVTVEAGASIDTNAPGGGIALVGSEGVSVAGQITAPQGQVVLVGAGSADIPLGTSGFINLKIGRSDVALAPSVDIGATGRVSAAGGQVLAEVTGFPAVGDGITQLPRISHAGLIETRAASGNGGSVTLRAGDNGAVFVSGQVLAQGGTGTGGTITVDGSTVSLASQIGANISPVLNADGATGGGAIRVGSTNTLDLSIDTSALLSADATGNGNGGTITALATRFTPPVSGGPVARVDYGVAEVYGTLQARGGPSGGNGGSIETSGAALNTRLRPNVEAAEIAGTFDARARSATGQAGTWTIDPFDVTISSTTAQGGVSGRYEPFRPGANVHATDLSRTLSNGTNVTVTSGTPDSVGTDFGSIFVTQGTAIEHAGPGQQTLTLSAAGNISMDSATVGTSGSGALTVNLLSDRDGDGQGGIFLNSTSIATGGGSVLMSGGLDPQTGFARVQFGGTGISLNGSTVNAVGAGSIGSVTLRGWGSDGEGAGDGINLFQSTLSGFGVTLIGRADSGNGVSLTNSNLNSRSPNGNEAGFGIDIRGVSRSNFGIPTGVSFSNTFVSLEGRAMRVLGLGEIVGTQGGNPIGISFDNLSIDASSGSAATVTLVGDATATGGTGMLGGANGSFSISAGEGGTSGVNVVIGASAGPGGTALDFQAGAPRIDTTGAVNIRPIGVTIANGDADGSTLDRLDMPIAIGNISADISTPFNLPDTWLLNANADLAAANIATPRMVIGSADHNGTIYLGTNALNSNVHPNIVLQNQGGASGGIVLDGNQSGPHVTLMSGGPITQTAPIVADNLTLVGNGTGDVFSDAVGDGPGTDVTLDNPGNLIGLLNFDGLRTLRLVKTGQLFVGGDTLFQGSDRTAFGFNPATGSFVGTPITTSSALFDVFLQTVGTNATVTLDQAIQMNGANSQVNILAPDGFTATTAGAISNGTGGRWQVWSTTWTTGNPGTLAGTGATPNLYGCAFTAGTTCGTSQVEIPLPDSGFRYANQPTLTITPTPISFVQGTPVPPIGFGATGFVNGDTATTAVTGALGTTATSQSTPGAYPVNQGTLASRQGYILNVATNDSLPVTVLSATSNPPLTTDLTAGSGRARGFDFDRLDFETSSEVNGRNLSRSLMCLAPGALRRQSDLGEKVDSLGMEWGRVRNQPHLSSCLEIGDENQCSAF